MATIKINNVTAISESGGTVVLDSAVTGIPAAGVTGVLPVGVTGGSGLTALGTNVLIGTETGVSTSSPVKLSLGGTYSSAAGANPKLNIYADASEYMGFGVSADQLDYIGSAVYSHVFYTNNAERLRIDGSGRVTMPSQPAFAAYRYTTGQTISADVWTTCIFNTERFDIGSNYNTSTGIFTAPVTGRYQLNGLATVTGIDDEYCYFQIITSNRNYGGVHQVPSTTGAEYEMMALSCLADMDAGDTAYLIVNSESDSSYSVRGDESEFTGFLVC